MSVVAAPERQFATYSRGEVREDILTSFRMGLRQLTNPDTGVGFSELDIASATAQLSRYYNEADAIDLTQQAVQYRGLFLADQIPIDTSSTAYLEGLHGPEWGEGKLAASGGSGPVTAAAAVGTVFTGSTTVPDPVALVGTAPDGKRYQLLFSLVTPANGIAGSDVLSPMLLKGVDTGEETNLAAGTLITWSNGPLGATGPATVTASFTGGTPVESDRDFAKRLLSRIRHKPASGNNAHFRAWSRESSNAVEDACVYACAFQAGSVLVAVLQKRANVLGPNARIPSVGTLTSVRNYLTPPGSPVVPNPPHVVVVPPVAVVCSMTIALALPKGRSSGWADLEPFPGQSAGTPATIVATATQTSFTLHSLGALPSGVTAPQMMIWNGLTSRFEKLAVLTVVSIGGSNYTVTLSSPASFTIGNGMYVCPFLERAKVVAETIEAYFDSLGPGEVIDLANDNRAHRAYRFPEPNEELPQRAGTGVLTFLGDALGVSLADSDLPQVTQPTPPVPSDVVDGPRLITPFKIGVYSF